MDRKGENRRIFSEDGCGAVALVHVAIQDSDPFGATLCLHGTRGYRHVVEYAVSRSMIREGMVGAAGQAGCHALPEGKPAGCYGTTDRTQATLHQFGRPGQTDPADLFVA